MEFKSLPFLTPVRYPGERTFLQHIEEGVDGYLSLGARRAFVIPGDVIRHVEIKEIKQSKINMFLSALKIISYVLFAPIVLLALSIKACFRTAHKFDVVQTPAKSSQIAKTETSVKKSLLNGAVKINSNETGNTPAFACEDEDDLPGNSFQMPEKNDDQESFSLITFMKEYLENYTLATPSRILPSFFMGLKPCIKIDQIIENRRLDLPQKIEALRQLRNDPQNFEIYLRCTTTIRKLLGESLQGTASDELSEKDLGALFIEGQIFGTYVSKIGKCTKRTEQVFDQIHYSLFSNISQNTYDAEIVSLAYNAILLGAFSVYHEKYQQFSDKQLAERFHDALIKRRNGIKVDVKTVEEQIRRIRSLKIDSQALKKYLNEKLNSNKEENQELLHLFSNMFFTSRVDEISDLYIPYCFASGKSFEISTGAIGGYDPSFPDSYLSKYCEKNFIPLYSDPDDSANSNSGWKIHINASDESMNSISRVVIPYLVQNHIHSKVSGSQKHYAHLQKIFTQRGKFITIYNNDYSNAKKVLKDVNALLVREGLSPLELKKIRGEASIDNSKLIFMRYGNFKNRGDLVTRMNSMGERQKDKVQDSRKLPFPEFIWKLKPEAFEGDERFFPDMSLDWRIPGTSLTVSLNSGEYSSWNEIFEPSKILPYVKKDKTSAVEKFLLVFDAYCEALINSDPSNEEMIAGRRAEIDEKLRIPSLSVS